MSESARDLWRLVPWLWLALSAGWAVVILVTDQLAWPLALWVATTLGPLTVWEKRRRREHPEDQVAQATTEEGGNR